MDWNRPRNVWQWLLLLTPAVAGIVAAQMAKWFMAPIPPLHLANGAWVANVGEHIGRVSSIALEAITMCSAALAVMLSRGPELGQRVLNAMFFMLCLLFLNSFWLFADVRRSAFQTMGRISSSLLLPTKAAITLPRPNERSRNE